MESIKIINTVSLLQSWLSKKNPMPYGTKFIIKDEDRIITLVQCEGYPRGKFIYETGEEFDFAKNVECEFIQVVEKKQEDERTSVYNEEVWNSVDNARNGIYEKGEYKPFKIKDEDKPLILKTFAEPQKKEKFHDFVFFDVTKIIDSLLKTKDENLFIKNVEIYKIINSLNNNHYPIFTKEKLYLLFSNCTFEDTRFKEIKKVKRNNDDLGYLISSKGNYMFSPKNKSFGDEYTYEDNQAIGFYYTAESYLDIALHTIKLDKERFITRYNTTPEKNNEDYGYHASATVKTLLAFASECYLKSLLLKEGNSIEDLKDLGHGLAMLFTSLDSEQIANVFNYMERNGYKLNRPVYESVYETNDLTDKFMNDLNENNEAFIDLRYSAENDKNTDYTFLYHFALALRNSVLKEYMISSPFGESIENNKNHLKK